MSLANLEMNTRYHTWRDCGCGWAAELALWNLCSQKYSSYLGGTDSESANLFGWLGKAVINNCHYSTEHRPLECEFPCSANAISEMVFIIELSVIHHEHR